MKFSYKYFCFLLVAMMFSAVVARADFSGSSWEFRSGILAGNVASDFVLLDLPSEIFSYLKGDLSDLRVVNDSGEVSYMIAAEKEYSAFTNLPAGIYNLSFVPGESTSFIVDVGRNGVFHNSIVINTSSENFRRMVEIRGSDDALSWRTLNPRGQIFDYTVRDIKPVSVRDMEVRYPDSTFRYLSVTIFDGGDAPLAVSDVRVAQNVLYAAREISYFPRLEIMENFQDKSTDIILDLGARGILHRRGRLTTSSINFSRIASLYDSDDGQEWRLLKQVYLFSIQTPKFNGSNLEFQYPESNKRYVKISISNGDDRPIDAADISLFGVVRRIMFSYVPGNTYYLYAGNPDAKHPQYDIEKISQYVDIASLDRVGSGPIEKNPNFIEREVPKLPLAERVPYALPTVLGVIVAILAFFLLRLFSKTRASGA